VTQYPASNLNAKLLVTKANTAGQTNLGTNAYDSVAITTSSIGATFTPWVQYVASMASEKVITGITVKLTSIGVVDWPIVIQIGVGGAGSETALCDIPVHETGSAVVPVVLPTWRGTDLACQTDGSQWFAIFNGATGDLVSTGMSLHSR
jgi:hypothetical protein